MSFSVKKSVAGVKNYPSLMGAAIRGERETLTVVYAVTSIISLAGSTGLAEYSVTPEGAELSGAGRIEFEYSGKGNPLDEAEEALKESLSVLAG
ncbi:MULTISPECIES: hypothetical protein [Klebsiella]|uniref:hypothetical protein n=1 Tax=Klebsiella TaxID=570 RepID=UPI0007CBC20E|nr:MULTISPECIES: hypothetical protein [Klebsiella]EGT0046066.1 hypothetical protein [Klebsiella oxytoca]ELR0729529.1 hypothetical protein [Klebsiella oxytoca]MBZ7339451.1 hypothetical protein [Klebsiella grimontii]MBZ7724813.1 hypothetical protein [Klebsiella oxytoca]MDM4543819.1 hypothetical protein [Klebsiella oxytoca]